MMKTIAIISMLFLMFSSSYAQTSGTTDSAASDNVIKISEVHDGVTTISTDIHNLIRLDTITLKNFKEELQSLGYKYSGVSGSGIVMSMNENSQSWHQWVTLEADELRIEYEKDGIGESAEFTNDLVDEMRPYFQQNIAINTGELCPEYVFTHNGKTYYLLICRNSETETIILKTP